MQKIIIKTTLSIKRTDPKKFPPSEQNIKPLAEAEFNFPSEPTTRENLLMGIELWMHGYAFSPQFVHKCLRVGYEKIKRDEMYKSLCKQYAWHDGEDENV